MRTIRIFLVDGVLHVLRVLRLRLSPEADLTVMGEAGDGREAVAMARALEPDVWSWQPGCCRIE